jgi:hypothetical protein
VYFNLLNKSIFKYFPFPYTVSTVHVVVGTAYCALVYLLGMKKLSFGRVGAMSRLRWQCYCGFGVHSGDLGSRCVRGGCTCWA